MQFYMYYVFTSIHGGKIIFISIIGVDGSGKTTHTKKISNKLENEHIKYKCTWLRAYYFTSSLLFAYCRLSGLTRYETQKGVVISRFDICNIIASISYSLCRYLGIKIYKGKKGVMIGNHEFKKSNIASSLYKLKNREIIGYRELYNSNIVSFLYPWVLFIDILPPYFLRIILPMHLGYSVISDRFIYDTLIDIMIDTHDYNIHRKYIGKLFLSLVPKDARIVLLDLDESLIKERREELAHDTSLRKRRELYHKIAEEFKIPIINNDMEIDKVQEELYKILMNKLCSKDLMPSDLAHDL